MSNWKVFKDNIEILTHTNADSLSLGKIGQYQVVVQKGLYNSGDPVIFAPEKSVLTGQIKTEFENYLAGPNKDRVKGIRLRGELSTGIIIPKHLVPNFDSYQIGEDISQDLGISEYFPPIPVELSGKVKTYDMPHIGHHDCEQAAIYVNDLKDDERIIISEKIHGSQCIYAYDFNTDTEIVSSKGTLKRGLVLEESEGNAYWRGVRNMNLKDLIKNNFKEGVIQVFGELVPVQGGYHYGLKDPTVLIFDIRVDGKSIPYDKISTELSVWWVPIIFDGNIILDKKEGEDDKIEYLLPKNITDLCKGMESVSGKKLHIREGIVLRPYIDRWAADGTLLRLKVINPTYSKTETGEEIN